MRQIILFRGRDGILFARDLSNGHDIPVLFHQDSFILPYGKNLKIDNRTGEQIYFVYQDDNETAFKLTLQSLPVGVGIGGGMGM
jgi:uncharacterized protein YqjF (DUF2071 family)